MPIDEHQVDAAAEAIMGKELTAQREAADQRRKLEEKLAARRRSVPFVLASLALGVLIGALAFGKAGLGAIVGVALGNIVAMVIFRSPGKLSQ
jgi:hypothetical protein